MAKRNVNKTYENVGTRNKAHRQTQTKKLVRVEKPSKHHSHAHTRLSHDGGDGRWAACDGVTTQKNQPQQSRAEVLWSFADRTPSVRAGCKRKHTRSSPVQHSTQKCDIHMVSTPRFALVCNMMPFVNRAR